MDAINKLLGSGGCQLLEPSATLVRPLEDSAYSCLVRIDGTQIKSITWTVDNKPVTVTNKSWMNKALIAGVDYIYFDYPATSITLNAAADSIMCYKQPV